MTTRAMIVHGSNPESGSLRAFAELIPQMVFVCDRGGRPLYFNGRFLEYIGISPNDARLDDLFEHVHPQDRPNAQGAWENSLSTGDPYACEVRLRKAADHSYNWFLSRAAAVRGPDGALLRWYGTLTDIEDQKRTEDTLQQLSDAANRFSATLGIDATLQLLADTSVEALADWCSIHTFDDDGNFRTAAIAHRDPKRLALARELTLRYPPREGELTERVARGGEAVLMPEIPDETLHAAAVDGEHYRLLKELGLRSAMTVPLRARGQRLGALTLVSAESGRSFSQNDLRLAQALAQRAAVAYDAARLIDELTRSEESLRQLVETMPQLVWISRAGDGRIEYVNRRWIEYFGLSFEQSRDWLMRDYVHPDDFEHANARWKHSLTTSEAYEVEYRLRKADGTYHWFLARGMPLRSGEDIVQWFGSATDIDAQRLQFERTRHVADTLQDAFIPRSFPQSERVAFDAAYIAAENEGRVGGDWYDAFELDDGTIVFSMGDVAGHGLEAAVTMTNVRQAIFGTSIDMADPARVLNKVNRIVCLQHSIMATAIVGFLREGTVFYATAGHPPPVFADLSGARFLAHGGIPLGIEPAAIFSTNAVEVPRGSLLVLYTDGLTEARKNVAEEEIRLLSACARAVRKPMSALDIRDDVLGPVRSSDDTAIMTLRF